MNHIIQPIYDWAANLPRGFLVVVDGNHMTSCMRFELWKEAGYEPVGVASIPNRQFQKPTQDLRHSVMIALGELKTMLVGACAEPPLGGTG